MSKKQVFALVVLCGFGILAAAVAYLLTQNPAVLSPKGIVAEKQSNLLIFATLLSLVVIVPVYILTFVIAWRYRESNSKSKYTPDSDGNRVAETVWWGIPIVIILILSVVTWNSSHALDPYRPLDSNVKPLRIQVVALQWKWLFIYPDQGIATVNYVKFPENTPLNFELTSDAPMNSFWVPELGGQVYAMAGMNTKLHLEANRTGVFAGSSANLSGEGFADMKFSAISVTSQEFDEWVKNTKNTDKKLDSASYEQLAKPSNNIDEVLYGYSEEGLYGKIILKFGGHNNHSDAPVNIRYGSGENYEN